MTPTQLLMLLTGGEWRDTVGLTVAPRPGEGIWQLAARRKRAWKRFENPFGEGEPWPEPPDTEGV